MAASCPERVGGGIDGRLGVCYIFVVCNKRPVLEVMQYEADP